LLLTCDLFYAAQPTRPPWMDVEVTRVIGLVYGDTGWVDHNPHSALPSLHAAMPVMYALWFAHRAEPLLRRMAPFIALWALGISWAVVYGGEHYVIDVLAGAGWATVWYYAFRTLLVLPFWSKVALVPRRAVVQSNVVALPAGPAREQREAA
jgi:membrane-associated phospholipid phosphatase